MPTPLINSKLFRRGVWGNSPLAERAFDQSIAVLLDEQWQAYDPEATNGEYVLTQATSGSAALATDEPGTLTLDAGATTQHQGANFQRVKSPFVPAANKSIWAEWYISLTAATPPVTLWQGFIGLAAIDTTVLPNGAHSTNNRIGWHTLTTEGLALTFGSDKAGTGTTKTGTTLVAATKIRLGFRYDGVADTLQQYINGVATGTVIATTHIPKAAIYPSFVCQSDGTDRPNLKIHGYRILQLR